MQIHLQKKKTKKNKYQNINKIEAMKKTGEVEEIKIQVIKVQEIKICRPYIHILMFMSIHTATYCIHRNVDQM